MILEHRIIIGCCTVILSYIAVKFILKVSKLKNELREQPEPFYLHKPLKETPIILYE